MMAIKKAGTRAMKILKHEHCRGLQTQNSWKAAWMLYFSSEIAIFQIVAANLLA